MTWLDLVTRIILGVGAVGYPIAFWMVITMRRWLGNKGTGWPRLLLNALVALLAVLAVLFGLSFGGTFGWFSALPLVAQLALSIGTVGAMALAPWGIIAALHRWRRAAEREARED